MLTISRKNINSLIDSFLKNPKEFENYVKGRLNALDKISLLKEMQYNDDIDDFSFFKTLFGAAPIDFRFIDLYEKYRKDIVDAIPKENIINVKTNIFYNDEIRMFLNRNNDINFYSRMICSLYSKNNDTSLQIPRIEKIYSIDELLSLIESSDLKIIDNFVLSENISKDEIDMGICTRDIILSDARLNSLNFDNKLVADFTTCKNDFDRKIWHILYGSFFHYIRLNIITFDGFDNDSLEINLSDDYNKIVDHLMILFNGIKTRYKKKGKEIPNSIRNVMADALCKLANDKDIDCSKNKSVIDLSYKKVK